MDQINKGKDVVIQAYMKQLLKNWKINYEFVYKAFFLKIASMMNSTRAPP